MWIFSMDKTYTGIGSRKAPIHILTLARMIGFKMASEGWCLRSGKAPGMDTNFYLGAMDWCYTQNPPYPPVAEIYLPWDGFEKGWHNDPSGHFINYQKLAECVKATELAACVHPNWIAVKRGGSFHMHSRNAMQILGRDLQQPTRVVFCWAPEDNKGVVSGGTATAVSIARLNKIPVRNLFYGDVYESALRFVGISESRLMALSGVLDYESTQNTSMACPRTSERAQFS